MTIEEENVPPWFNILRGDLSGVEARITAGVDRMVTKDVFEAEQKYQAERHQQALERIREERTRAEKAERDLADELVKTQAAQATAEETRKKDRRSFWAWLFGGMGAIAGIMTAIGAIFHPFGH